MDGIAIARGGEGRRRFRIAGIQAAGAPVLALASGADCIEVMTGAVMPHGCDTVVPIEQIETADGLAELHADCEPASWRHVHRQGSDARAGDLLLAARDASGGA